MFTESANTTLEQPFAPVKSATSDTVSPPSDPMIHHKVPGHGIVKRRLVYSRYRGKAYGVSRSRRVLSPQLLLKRFDQVRDCLEYVLGLTTAQREVTLRLLRLWAYYGSVYPKESQITEDPGCSKATFWRTVRILEELGLIDTVNRYVIRPHAQISNLYRLDNLVILLAKYLAEHIAHVWESWLIPWIRTPWPELWKLIGQRGESSLSHPGGLSPG